MATLDRLLQAVIDHQMDSLLLEPGRLPRLSVGEQEREVSQTHLDQAILQRLLDEVRGSNETGESSPGASFEFDYGVGEAHFRFLGRGESDGWHVMIRPIDEEVVTLTPVEVEATPILVAADELGETSTAAPRKPDPGGIPGLSTLLAELIECSGSDLHLSSEQIPRLRVHGAMTELDYPAPTPERLEEILEPIMPEANVEEFGTANDTDFAHELADGTRFRVNVFRDQQGIGAVLRHIPSEIPSFEDLRLPDKLRQVGNLSKGLVLVTGPTGSGKSTTLAALIDLINRTRRDHIISIEDPIEFVHPSRGCMVNQRQVGLHTSSFKSALRAALREDPDIVLVGEMRDLETVAIAIETAETGHLVFGTLHTTTAPSTIERLVDQFPAGQQSQIRTMLSESLVAVIAQNLLPKVGGGRVAAFEILICTAAISNLIREGKTFQIPSAMQTGKRLGMRLLNDSLTELVTEGLVEPAEAYRKAADKDGIMRSFQHAEISFDPESIGDDLS